MAPSVRILVADRGDSGVRLDLVVRRHLRDVEAATRTRVQAWIEGGRVTVNGATIRRVAARAALGDVVSVAVPEPKPRRAMSAEDVALEILYEDDHLLALNKPAGVVVHPAYKHPTGTLMNALLWRARAWPDGGRPSIVGRLDKETTGIVLVAKTPAVHASLQRAMNIATTVERPFSASAREQRKRAAADAPKRLWREGGQRRRRGRRDEAESLALHAKDYLAVVYGRVPARGQIDLRLRLNPRDRRRVVASDAVGAHSVTLFERLAHVRAPRAGLALLRCRLVTGRRHQIRVHLAARGWPIVGDKVYDAPALGDGGIRGAAGRWSTVTDPMLQTALRAFPRQALHAWRVAFAHPITGEPVRIEAPIPRDMSDLVAMAGLTASAIS